MSNPRFIDILVGFVGIRYDSQALFVVINILDIFYANHVSEKNITVNFISISFKSPMMWLAMGLCRTTVRQYPNISLSGIVEEHGDRTENIFTKCRGLHIVPSPLKQKIKR